MGDKKGFFNGIIEYVKGAYDELIHHVVWPSWKEAQKLTVVVAVFSLVFALLLFAVDYIFRQILGLYYKMVK